MLVAGMSPIGKRIERLVEEVFSPLTEYVPGYPVAYQHVREETLALPG